MTKATVALLFSLCFSANALAVSPERVILEKVELENESGEWITVAEPDKPVDTVSGEAGVSFFNNGRVPEAGYVNFRIKVQEGDPVSVYEITGVSDFSPPFFISGKAFVSVWFILTTGSFENLPLYIREVELTIDQSTTIFARDKINIVRLADQKEI